MGSAARQCVGLFDSRAQRAHAGHGGARTNQGSILNREHAVRRRRIQCAWGAVVDRQGRCRCVEPGAHPFPTCTVPTAVPSLVHNCSSPLVSIARKKHLRPTLVKGEETWTRLTNTVPASMPLLFHNSVRPVFKSTFVKKSVPSTWARLLGREPVRLALMSLSRCAGPWAYAATGASSATSITTAPALHGDVPAVDRARSRRCACERTVMGVCPAGPPTAPWLP
jgi:hypothetical protein